ncbi:hypothetical protein BDR07DRAFT_1093835 [Suillus spraguei]|nr:hypothetical protein BDR07DRAFT_1093835 [Suillus spraguei]
MTFECHFANIRFLSSWWGGDISLCTLVHVIESSTMFRSIRELRLRPISARLRPDHRIRGWPLTRTYSSSKVQVLSCSEFLTHNLGPCHHGLSGPRTPQSFLL